MSRRKKNQRRQLKTAVRKETNMSMYKGCRVETASTKSLIEPSFNEIKDADVSLKTVSDGKASTLELEKVRVVIPHDVHRELMTFVRLIDEEINGLGMVRKEGNNFIIEEIFLLDQEVSSGACDIKPDAMVKLMQTLIEQGKNPSNIRFWWHSHNKMGTFWSNTDVNTSKNFAGSEWLVSLVTNHAGDVKAKVNFFNPIEFALDNVEVAVMYPDAQGSIVDKCKELVKQKVKKTSWTYPKHVGFHGSQVNDIKAVEQGAIFVPGGLNTTPAVNEARRENILQEIENGPYGGRVVVDQIIFTWNKLLRKYEAEDLFSHKQMTEKEIIDRLGYDYNGNAKRYLDEQEKSLKPVSTVDAYEGYPGYEGFPGHLGHGYDY